jgi:phosphate:Na+ symporter
MQEILFPFAGGLGLFLIGMMLLSGGLVAFGGDVLKNALARFTGTPTKAFVSGALATAVVQSSSATTVTMIGFVSAGLITFTQAIGVLIGASLGNTATGWIVAELGLKVDLGFYTLPLIGIGALMKLMLKGRAAELGLAMAGFGLMFAGLTTLQEGMSGLAGVFNLASLPQGGLGANLLILAFGLGLTAVLQSSTAAIALTLTALHTQTINFEQASALVVGAAIGTTITGALVTIGGTIHAKRTALAYVLFNAAAGLLAMALLPLLFWVIEWLGTHAGLDAGATSLAAFHTLFIALGVALILPVVPQFAALVERLLPDRSDSGEVLTQRLDASLLAIPSVALEASQRALEQVTLLMLGVYRDLLRGPLASVSPARLQALGLSLETIYGFVGRIELPPSNTEAAARRIAQLHALDHLMRFRTRLEDLLQARVELNLPDYHWALEHSQTILALAEQGLATQTLPAQMEELEVNAAGLTALSRQMRHELLEGAALQRDSLAASPAAHVLAKSDAYRWLERTGHHIWRIGHYLSQGRPQPSRGGDIP